MPLFAPLRLTTLEGQSVAPLAYCTNIGMGGLRATAERGLVPGTAIQVAVELPSGRTFKARGVVAWCKTTLHPALFGSTERSDDDAVLGITFASMSMDDLLPIARLLAAREAERQRGRRLRRGSGIVIHA